MLQRPQFERTLEPTTRENETHRLVAHDASSVATPAPGPAGGSTIIRQAIVVHDADRRVVRLERHPAASRVGVVDTLRSAVGEGLLSLG